MERVCEGGKVPPSSVSVHLSLGKQAWANATTNDEMIDTNKQYNEWSYYITRQLSAFSFTSVFPHRSLFFFSRPLKRKSELASSLFLSHSFPLFFFSFLKPSSVGRSSLSLTPLSPFLQSHSTNCAPPLSSFTWFTTTLSSTPTCLPPWHRGMAWRF